MAAASALEVHGGLAREAAAVASEVHAFLAGLEPYLLGVGELERASEALRDSLLRLRTRAEALLALWQVPLRGAEVRLREALVQLASALPEPSSLSNSRADWLALRDRLLPLYAETALALRAYGARVELFRPTNWLRSAVHLSSGLAVLAIFELVFTQKMGLAASGAFVVWAWSLEGLRRVSPAVNRACMAFFGPIARDHERHGVNAATWYGTALLVLAVTAYGWAGGLGVLALAVGDPLAGMIGRAFGKTKLPGGKSLEGALAFAGSTFVAGALYLGVAHPELGWFALGLAGLAGVVGATTEVLSTRVQDNFSIPVVVAWAGVAASWLLGL